MKKAENGRPAPHAAGEGLLIVVSGPSGSGKGTVLARLLSQREGLYYSVSATTRAPRPGERDGKDYYFLSREEFLRRVEGGRMLEHAEYCGNFYGTPRDAVEENSRKGLDTILEIEVQGAKQVQKASPGCVSVFIVPPCAEELERRLRGRGTESEDVIRKRLKASIRELELAGDYDYIVVNDTVEAAAARLDAILTAEKCRAARLTRGEWYPRGCDKV